MFLKRLIILSMIILSATFCLADESIKSVTIRGETLNEKVSARGYNYKSFVDAEGRINRYQFHAGHIHYKDGTDFKDIDTRLTFNDVDKSWEHNKASYRPKIPEYADGWFEFYNAYKGINHTIKARPVANHVKGEYFEDETGYYVLYKDAFGSGIDLKVYSYWAGIKKVIVINKKPADVSEPLKFEFELILPLPEKDKIRDRDGITWDNLSKLDFKSKTLKIGEDGKESYFRDAMIWDSGSLNQSVDIELFIQDNKIYLRKTITPDILKNAIYPLFTDHPTVYYAGSGDGHVYSYLNSWDAAHDATTGTAAYASNNAYSGSGYNNVTIYYYIYRFFCPIDTSGIDDSATVSAASLYVYPWTVYDTDNDGDDWVAVVQTTQASDTSLTANDFDNVGSVDNPNEGSARYDITNFVNTGYNQIDLNSTGISYVSKTGYTKIGLREGHDCLDSPVASSNGTTGLRLWTSEYSGREPYLDVEISAGGPSGNPISSTMQFQGIQAQGISVN